MALNLCQIWCFYDEMLNYFTYLKLGIYVSLCDKLNNRPYIYNDKTNCRPTGTGHMRLSEQRINIVNKLTAYAIERRLPFADFHYILVAGGRVCSFSPCIEQVQRTCECLTQLGFTDVKTIECLSRTFDVRTINMTMPDLGYTTTEDSEKGVIDVGGSYHHPEVGHLEPVVVRNIDNDDGDEYEDEEDNKSSKKAKHHEDKDGSKTIKTTSGDKPQPTFFFKSGLAPMQMPGHTGYLTFATLFPQY